MLLDMAFIANIKFLKIKGCIWIEQEYRDIDLYQSVPP